MGMGKWMRMQARTHVIRNIAAGACQDRSRAAFVRFVCARCCPAKTRHTSHAAPRAGTPREVTTQDKASWVVATRKSDYFLVTTRGPRGESLARAHPHTAPSPFQRLASGRRVTGNRGCQNPAHVPRQHVLMPNAFAHSMCTAPQPVQRRRSIERPASKAAPS
eukprot:scaffold17506_cov132-Isochrysis_galbana.AAC.4